MTPSEQKAIEIVTTFEETSNFLGETWPEYRPKLASAIAKAINDAVREERERASSAVIAQAYWRHQGATPDRNTQTDEEIYAQDEAYERHCLLYMTGELDEYIEPLTEIQWNEIKRRAAAIRSRDTENG